MKKTLIIFLLLLLLTYHGVWSQGIFKTYTVSDGLVSNNVRTIYQDSAGFLWIVTWEGLSRYDGHKFINFTTANGLSHSMLNDVAEEYPGLLYVAANNGDVYSIRHNKVEKNKTLSGAVINRFIKEPGKKLLGATDRFGIVELKANQLYPVAGKGEMSVHGFIEKDSFLLVAADKFGVIAYRNGEKKGSLPDKGLVAWRIFKDMAGRIWLCTHVGLRLVTFEKGKLHYAALPTAFRLDALSDSEIKDLYEWEDGTLWFATGKGLVSVFPDGTSKIFTAKDGLPSTIVTCFFRDREKNLWIGTYAGFSRFQNTSTNMSSLFDDAQTNQSAYIIHLPNNHLAVCSKYQVKLFSKKDKKWSDVATGHQELFYAVLKNAYPLVLINQQNMFLFDSLGKLLKKIKIPITETYFNAIRFNQSIVLGADHGLLIVEGDKLYRIPGFDHRVIAVAAGRDGRLWIGTWQSGVFCVRRNSNGILVFETVPALNALPDKSIRSLFIDSDDQLWVGTRYGGAACLTPLPNGGWQQTVYNVQTGMVSNWALDFDEDDSKNIWVGGHTGITKLVKNDSGYRVFNYSRINNYFPATSSLAVTGHNQLLVGTYTGLDAINDNELENIAPLPVTLTLATVGPYNAPDTMQGQSLQLDHRQNTALFEFSSPGFINEKELLYSYRLLGSGDTAWSTPANIHSVQYASLQPGNYHFEVRNIGWNGQSGQTTTFHFIIEPPFWQTWWFYGLVVVVLAFVFYSIYRYRIKQLIRLQKVRNSIATDLHDDIGSTLTNISILTELSKKNLEEPQTAQVFLGRIAEESIHSQQALDDIIWSVNTRNDSLEQTLARMRRYAAELFDNSDVHCHLQLDEISSYQKLNMEQRRDVFLIYKECLNNVRKHAFAGNLWISVKHQGSTIHLTVKDDGKGFGTDQSTHRNGMKNMKERTEKWKGSFTVSSKPGAGTLIEIAMPVAG